MTSSFSWLDHSEAQRRQMLELIDLFREKGTLDELGFGSIRDAFSDHFFPGTSTLHTRARYLLFVPWIYRRIEQDRVPPSQVESRARKDQASLARALQLGGEGDAQGVIGIQAGEALQRTPKAIYWTALRRFRIWRFPGSMEQYHTVLRRAGASGAPGYSDDGELVERSSVQGWHSALPQEPEGLLQSARLDLGKEEAEYLRERIVVEAPGSLLSLCVESKRHVSRIEYPWLHPDLAAFPAHLRADLEHARRFSVLAYGAALLYNLMLAEKAEAADLPVANGLVELRRSELNAWADDAGAMRDLRTWRMNDLWRTVVDKGHRIPYPARQFVEGIAETVHADPKRFADHAVARQMILQRESALKGGLARLSNRRALERFTGAAGLVHQTYRWPNVQRLVSDIHDGLRLTDAPGEVQVA
jgi:hypothetical protein